MEIYKKLSYTEMKAMLKEMGIEYCYGTMIYDTDNWSPKYQPKIYIDLPEVRYEYRVDGSFLQRIRK